jgi:hypothetical protein
VLKAILEGLAVEDLGFVLRVSGKTWQLLYVCIVTDVWETRKWKGYNIYGKISWTRRDTIEKAKNECMFFWRD